MLIAAIILIALGLTMVIGALIFVTTRPCGIMRPSERFFTLIASAVGGLLALVGTFMVAIRYFIMH